MKIFFTLLLVLNFVPVLIAQTLTNLPPDIPYSILEQDPENLVRPRLTLYGFNSTSAGTRSVRKLIEEVYINQDEHAKASYVRVVNLSRLPLYLAGVLRNKSDLSNIYAARAMEALISYIMQESCVGTMNEVIVANGVASKLKPIA